MGYAGCVSVFVYTITVHWESLAGINFGKFALSEHLVEKSLANE